ncbi:hypothetical protein V6N11_038229 [Hibiscus sabdariffa]|uniref:Uncharacterized protein n=1 Tax=Hibiscus sabdariffa TaxID=183260 RepID=A0ABR2SJF1_9ROSI
MDDTKLSDIRNGTVMLATNGRLVFFYRVLREDGSVENHFPEQLWYSHVLLTMKKSSYTEELAVAAARIKHLEFKENHLRWLENGNLHSSVFSPADAESGDSKVKNQNRNTEGNMFSFTPVLG